MMHILNPENYRGIGPIEAYSSLSGNFIPQKPVPEIFSCDLEGDKLIIKTGHSEFKFSNGKTFHNVLKDNDFKIVKHLGEGGSNKAELIEIAGKLYILRSSKGNDKVNNFLQRSICAGYFRECVHYTILSPSPYIMKVFAVECSSTHAAMLIEYVEGSTLTKWLNNNPSIDERKRIIRELNEGIKYIHSKLISHYDIKSDNIFVPLDTLRPPFFIDFGSSGRRETNNNSWKYHASSNMISLSSLVNTIMPHNKLRGGKHRRFSNRKNNRKINRTIKIKRIRKL